ncbi:hypothetical protein [Photobacterium kishitanii]|uniref:Uncharacterized protein n=1 Tax=Photobacterium kishitanii TaxID=318456 RepID=A0A2T3KEJ7_9GAMM|nr:hypothetical protein [Photobacterium kishitanii]PSU83828.1 hypothetical protein C0W42_22370 [Photobacterium kishitanii]PSU95710.1 hypothetical protein C9J27_17710 [Photobacterium kishitanii]
MKYTLIALSLVAGNAYAEDWEIEGVVDSNGDMVCIDPQGVKEGDRVFCDGELLYIQGVKSSEVKGGGSTTIYLSGEDVRRGNETKGVMNTTAKAPSGTVYGGSTTRYQSIHASYIYNYASGPRTFTYKTSLRIGARSTSDVKYYRLNNHSLSLNSLLHLAPDTSATAYLTTQASTLVEGDQEQYVVGYGYIVVDGRGRSASEESH